MVRRWGEGRNGGRDGSFTYSNNLITNDAIRNRDAQKQNRMRERPETKLDSCLRVKRKQQDRSQQHTREASGVYAPGLQSQRSED